MYASLASPVLSRLILTNTRLAQGQPLRVSCYSFFVFDPHTFIRPHLRNTLLPENGIGYEKIHITVCCSNMMPIIPIHVYYSRHILPPVL